PDLLAQVAVDDGRLGGTLDADGFLLRVVGGRLRRNGPGCSDDGERRQRAQRVAELRGRTSGTAHGHGSGWPSLAFFGGRCSKPGSRKVSAIYVLRERRAVDDSQESPRAKKN